MRVSVDDYHLYYGKLKDNVSYTCTVINLLLNNVISLNGTIDMNNLNKCKKRHLWVYIMYLAQNNPGIEPFIAFEKDNLPRIIKENVVELSNYTFFLKSDLAKFINQFLAKNKDLVNIKIIHQVLDVLINQVKLLDQALVDKINAAKVHQDQLQ